MSGTLKTYRKADVERRRLYLDYSCWLEELETLTDFQATVSPYDADQPLWLDVAYPNADHTKLVMFASGGIAGRSYTVSMKVTTTAGQVKKDDIGIMVTK